MKNKGFTLIEMLIVITIIVLLAGMVFRMVAGIGKSNDIAKTRATIEKVANAIEEFRSIYGKYPPVSVYEDAGQPVRYEFPGPGTFNATSGGLITQILNGDRLFVANQALEAALIADKQRLLVFLLES